jgi:hypothetical protein
MSANLTFPNVLTPKEIGSTICDRLFAGESLSEICRDAAMPDKPTVMRWLAQDLTFIDEFGFTCQLLAEHLATEADNHASLRLALRHWVADRLPQSEPY